MVGSVRQVVAFCALLALFAGLSLDTVALAMQQSAQPYSQFAEQQTKGNQLPTISAVDLPPEARTVLNLIKQGGPFPYRKDGTTFQNRERRLPVRPKGYYKEYTVKTPGRSDRGPRRIVTGAKGELYFTDDHYRTFKLIAE